MVGEMTYEHNGASALDYLSCGYGQSRLSFRGPERSLDAPYGVFIGGTETYGKFVARPFPALLEDQTGLTGVNLGVINAGIETFHSDPTVLRIARGAAFVVLQVMGPQYVSNAFYSVHPRRNDRFIRAKPPLVALYPQLDFTEFHFVGHLLSSLRRASPQAFGRVVLECRKAWLTSVIGMIRRVERPVVLLWLPHVAGQTGRAADPFVDEQLLAPLRKRSAGLVQVLPSSAVQAVGTAGMVFGAMEAFAAADLPNPLMHGLIATRLKTVLGDLGMV